MAQSSPLLQLVFRVSVVIGCAALLLGIAGIFYFRDRLPQEVERPQLDSAAVILDTSVATEDFEIVARWAAADGTPREERGRRSADPATWLFEEAPQAVPLDLVVFRNDAGHREEVHRLQAILHRGAMYQAVLPR